MYSMYDSQQSLLYWDYHIVIQSLTVLYIEIELNVIECVVSV